MRSTHSGLSSSLTDLDHAPRLAAETGSIKFVSARSQSQRIGKAKSRLFCEMDSCPAGRLGFENNGGDDDANRVFDIDM
jgi:hypothetical protein